MNQAKAILFLLTQNTALADETILHFEKILGPMEIRGPWHLFENNYYEEEMGLDLKRCVVGFKNLFEPWRLSELKEMTRQCESRFTIHDSRTINIDPGYVDLFKVVLASGKGGGQKICVAENVHAHTLLRYEKGKWISFEWSFPDFKSEIYHADLLKIRKSLKESFREKPLDC